MVKAVQLENEMQEAPQQPSSSDVTIENPEDDVEFKIDFNESSAPALPSISKNAIGGTELMRQWLYEELGKRQDGLLDEFQLISTRVREL